MKMLLRFSLFVVLLLSVGSVGWLIYSTWFEHIWLLACPEDVTKAFPTAGVYELRMLLEKREEHVLVVKRDAGEIRPVQHYWPLHDAPGLQADSVSYKGPRHISAWLIVKKSTGLGIAIRTDAASPWHVYWVTDKDMRRDEGKVIVAVPNITRPCPSRTVSPRTPCFPRTPGPPRSNQASTAWCWISPRPGWLAR